MMAIPAMALSVHGAWRDRKAALCFSEMIKRCLPEDERRLLITTQDVLRLEAGLATLRCLAEGLPAKEQAAVLEGLWQPGLANRRRYMQKLL